MSPSASRYFRSALQVEPKRIARLEDTELGELMGQLLRAQSYRCGAPVSELLTNTQEKAADGQGLLEVCPRKDCPVVGPTVI